MISALHVFSLGSEYFESRIVVGDCRVFRMEMKLERPAALGCAVHGSAMGQERVEKEKSPGLEWNGDPPHRCLHIPIADLPVHEIVSIHCEIGTSHSNGEFIREVPAEELAPYFHSRNDDLDALLGG